MSRSIYHRGIGSPIPIAIATEWISNSEKSALTHREKDQAQHTLSRVVLADALSLSHNIIGATFQNAIDSYGAHHILFVPFIEGLAFSNDVASILDMTTGATVNRVTAALWRTSYTESHPGSIRYYFFGRDVLDEIVNSPSVVQIEAVQGLTNDGEFKLVLLAHQNESLTGGRLTGEAVAYDNSCPCPNTCADF